MTALRPAVFLDKDGTLLEDVPFNADPARMRWTATAPAALELLGALRMPLFVVTNQPGVAQGLLAQADMNVIAAELCTRFAQCGAALSGYYYCAHAAPTGDGDAGCDCRKPQAGMLLRAAAEHDIELSASWMVGDILDDIEAGRRVGCRTILVDNGNETEWRLAPERIPHVRVSSLLAAAIVIALASASGIASRKTA